MVLSKIKKVFGGTSVDYKVTDPKVWAAIQKRANQMMRTEVLPLLGQNRIRATSWNPLRIDPTGAIQLWTQDKLALEIMQNPELMNLTADVVVAAIMEVATIDNPQSFLQDALDSLRDDFYGGN